MALRKTSEEYFVYLATNDVNRHRYVGVTGKSVSRRKSEHRYWAEQRDAQTPFHRAIRKYGFEVFGFEILSRWTTRANAIQGEISAIAELRPEYNRTLGGDGNLGRVMAEASRRRIGDSKRGNKYNLGKKHTDETKKRIGINSMEYSAEWAARRHKGPEASSRPVVCLDDGLTFVSASAAARHYDVPKSALIELCLGQRGRKTVGKRRFAYAEVTRATG